jgi:Lar family restriction alleviation protein
MSDNITASDAEFLKPCPFCRETDCLTISHEDNVYLVQEASSVRCTTCDACGPKIYGERSRQLAIDAWNIRLDFDTVLHDARAEIEHWKTALANIQYLSGGKK